MKFKELNISNERTAYINVDLVQLIECDSKTNNAILTMSNGDIYHTNEDYDELLHDWGIKMNYTEYKNYIENQ